MGGSADLAPSNMTLPLRQEDFKMFHVVDHYQSATAYSFTTFKHEAAMCCVLCVDWTDKEVLQEVQLVLNLRMKCTGDFLKDSYAERNMRFGIREFGMGAVANALSLDKTGRSKVNR